MTFPDLSVKSQMKAHLEELQKYFISHKHFLTTLTALGIDPKTTNLPVIMDFFPDGGCDFVRALVDGTSVVTLDIPWNEAKNIRIKKVLTLEQYGEGLSIHSLTKFNIAKELAKGR